LSEETTLIRSIFVANPSKGAPSKKGATHLLTISLTYHNTLLNYCIFSNTKACYWMTEFSSRITGSIAIVELEFLVVA
jgi:hypothetical protein